MDVLQFSGGKDSLACLYLLREKWAELTVVWANAGSPWPETAAQMDEIKNLVPNFIEIQGDVHKQNEVLGIPSDVVPLINTLPGQVAHGKNKILIQSWMTCCGANIWEPMRQVVDQLKPKVVYRGQRNEEVYKSIATSGVVVNGIQYIFPIEDWTGEQVDKFLIENGIKIPSYYEFSDKSLDCWHCTAYLDERQRQIRYLREKHPEKYDLVQKNLHKIEVAVMEQVANIRAAL